MDTYSKYHWEVGENFKKYNWLEEVDPWEHGLSN